MKDSNRCLIPNETYDPPTKCNTLKQNGHSGSILTPKTGENSW